MAIPFSDTTNKSGLIQLCEQYTALSDGAISGNSTLLKTFTRHINNAYQKIVTMVLESMDDWTWDDIGTTDGSTGSETNYPIATFPLVTGQRDYPLGATMKVLSLQRVDVTYDGTNWYRATPFDSQQFLDGMGNDTLTDANFNRTQPYYDLRANSLFIFPEPSTGDDPKCRIEFTREPSEFASDDTTKTPGIDSPFQPMIAVGASLDWAMINAPSIAQMLGGQYADWEARLKRFYSRKDEDIVYGMKSLGSEWDYR